MELPYNACQTPLEAPAWPEPFRQLLSPAHTWSVYSDSSWRAVKPIQARAAFGLQGSHLGRGALFLSAELPDWCSEISAISFEIPPILRALGGSPDVAELLAIPAGLQLFHIPGIHGTVYSDCLSAVKKIKITRKWTPGHSFQEAGASLVSSCRAYLSSTISLPPSREPPFHVEPSQVTRVPD